MVFTVLVFLGACTGNQDSNNGDIAGDDARKGGSESRVIKVSFAPLDAAGLARHIVLLAQPGSAAEKSYPLTDIQSQNLGWIKVDVELLAAGLHALQLAYYLDHPEFGLVLVAKSDIVEEVWDVDSIHDLDLSKIEIHFTDNDNDACADIVEVTRNSSPHDGAALPPPETPVGISLLATPGQISLSWSAVACVAGYAIYYNTVGGVTIDDEKLDNIAATPSGTRVSFSHSGLASGTEYFYRVISYNALGESPLSDEVKGSTPADGTPGGGSQTEFTISGVVHATAGGLADSDVNDPNAFYRSNDNAADFQSVSNPVTIGGFASAVGTGVSGDRFAGTGDIVDTYRVALAAGQWVNVQIADFNPANPALTDLDLYLYLPQASLPVVSSECDVNDSESVSAPAAGDYDVVVVARSGITNYVLDVGAPSGQPCPTLAVQYDFVPGEAIVDYRSDTRTAAGQSGKAVRVLMSESQPAATTVVAGYRPPRYAVTKTDAALQVKLDTIQFVKSLRARADVLSADLNFLRKPYLQPNDPYYAQQWHYPLINLQQAWDQTTGSSDVVVAVVDTGIDMDHPDLAQNIASYGYDFISDPGMSGDGDGIDSNPDDPGDRLNGGSSSFHGTHVAGTIAAVGDNGIGVTGIAWNSKIMPLRVLGSGGGTDYDIIQAVRYAIQLPNDANIVPAQQARIINFSLGGPGFSAALQSAMQDARNAGVIIIAAAGNEGVAMPSYPAAFDGVISVAAVDVGKNHAYYSNFGATIDIAAPGGDQRKDVREGILSTLVDDAGAVPKASYGFYQGTSMAAPHMAGVVALMKSVYPALTPDELDVLISAGAVTEDLAADGPATRDDNFGYGLIDALKAVQHARQLGNGGVLPPVLRVTPNRLDFGFGVDSIALTTANSGGGTLSIQSIVADAPWLSVAESAVDQNKLGIYLAAVNRGNLPNSVYTAKLRVSTNVGVVDLPVTMQVGKPISQGDAGFQYMLLVHAATRSVSGEVSSAGNNGNYPFSFKAVSAGEYYLISGSDMDNDAFICDAGESCGGYPSLGGPQKIIIQNADVKGLEFYVNFAIDFGANAQFYGAYRH